MGSITSSQLLPNLCWQQHPCSWVKVDRMISPLWLSSHVVPFAYKSRKLCHLLMCRAFLHSCLNFCNQTRILWSGSKSLSRVPNSMGPFLTYINSLGLVSANPLLGCFLVIISKGSRPKLRFGMEGRQTTTSKNEPKDSPRSLKQLSATAQRKRRLSHNQNPVCQWSTSRTMLQEWRRRPQLFLVGIAPY